MAILTNFLSAFFFSFAGSMPPGTINLILLDLGLKNKIRAAFRFAFAAALVEYPHAWIAVKFGDLILNSPAINENIKLSGGLVMIVFGLLSLVTNKTQKSRPVASGGFRRGIIVGILNPFAIPFWLAVTTFLKSHQLFSELNAIQLHAYLVGVVLGAFCFLVLLVLLSKKIASKFNENKILRLVPGLILVVLGSFSLVEFFLPK